MFVGDGGVGDGGVREEWWLGVSGGGGGGGGTVLALTLALVLVLEVELAAEAAVWNTGCCRFYCWCW